jgi:hypothetical protein
LLRKALSVYEQGKKVCFESIVALATGIESETNEVTSLLTRLSRLSGWRFARSQSRQKLRVKVNEVLEKMSKITLNNLSSNNLSMLEDAIKAATLLRSLEKDFQAEAHTLLYKINEIQFTIKRLSARNRNKLANMEITREIEEVKSELGRLKGLSNPTVILSRLGNISNQLDSLLRSSGNQTIINSPSKGVMTTSNGIQNNYYNSTIVPRSQIYHYGETIAQISVENNIDASQKLLKSILLSSAKTSIEGVFSNEEIDNYIKKRTKPSSIRDQYEQCIQLRKSIQSKIKGNDKHVFAIAFNLWLSLYLLQQPIKVEPLILKELVMDCNAAMKKLQRSTRHFTRLSKPTGCCRSIFYNGGNYRGPNHPYHHCRSRWSNQHWYRSSQ